MLPAELELESHPVAVRAGLTTDMPWNGLPSYMERGPTPAAPTCSATRRPITIDSVKAGSKKDDAELTLDDNEFSKWKSEGGSDNAWITYRFEKKEVVNAVLPQARSLADHELSDQGDGG